MPRSKKFSQLPFCSLIQKKVLWWKMDMNFNKKKHFWYLDILWEKMIPKLFWLLKFLLIKKVLAEIFDYWIDYWRLPKKLFSHQNEYYVETFLLKMNFFIKCSKNFWILHKILKFLRKQLKGSIFKGVRK